MQSIAPQQQPLRQATSQRGIPERVASLFPGEQPSLQRPSEGRTISSKPHSQLQGQDQKSPRRGVNLEARQRKNKVNAGVGVKRNYYPPRTKMRNLNIVDSDVLATAPTGKILPALGEVFQFTT